MNTRLNAWRQAKSLKMDLRWEEEGGDVTDNAERYSKEAKTVYTETMNNNLTANIDVKPLEDSVEQLQLPGLSSQILED